MSTDPTFVAMIERNLDYFEGLLESDPDVAASALIPHLNALYRAIDFASREPAVNHRAGQLFVRSWTAIENHGNYQRWANLAIRIANRFEHTDTFLLCRIVTLIGGLLQISGDSVKAQKIFRKAEQLALENEDTRALVNAWYYLATYEYRLSNIAAAEELAKTVIEQVESELSLDDESIRRIYGFALTLSGLTANFDKRYDESIRFAERAIVVLKGLKTGHDFIVAEANLAQHLVASGQTQKGRTLFKQIAEYCKQYGLTTHHSTVLDLLIPSLMDDGQLDEALLWSREYDLAALMRSGNLKQVAYAKRTLGLLQLRIKNFDEAKSLVDEAIELLERSAADLDWSEAVGQLGFVYLGMEAFTLAEDAFATAVAGLSDGGGRVGWYAEQRALFQAALEKRRGQP